MDVGATLRVDGVPGAQGAKTVVLESFDGTRWTRAASGRTDASGRAAWRFVLGRGQYRVRASYTGSEEIAPATSTPVTLTIR